MTVFKGFPTDRKRCAQAIAWAALALLPAMARADGLEGLNGLGIMLDGGYAYDSNLGNASAPDDKRSDSALTLNLGANKAWALTDHTRLALNGSIETTAFAQYDGLDRLSADLELSYQYRPSGDFGAPIFGIVAAAGRDQYRSDLRRNNHYSAGLTWRQPLTDRIGLFAALKDNVSRSDNAVFDTRYTSTQLNVDYGLGNGKTLYLSGEYRVGDIVSTSEPELTYRAISRAWINDDVFSSGEVLRDYRLGAKTALFRLGYNMALAGKSSLDLSWRYARSASELTTGYDGAPVTYIGNQFALDYLVGF